MSFRDFKITDGDLVFDGVDLASVTETDAIAQSVAIELRTMRGEVFTDLDAGVPYIPDILSTRPTDEQIRSIIRPRVLSIEGVTGIARFDIVRDADRTATIEIDVDTDLGEIRVEPVSIQG